MKMQSLKRAPSAAQSGFTLIELIVVIVILGILAATALPKFADLGGDARRSTVNAARGSLESVSAMVRGRYLINSTTPIVMEGITVATSNGYAAAAAATISAAGLSNTSDWQTIPVSTTGSATTGPTTGATEIAVVPASIYNTASAVSCYVKYTAATTTAAPVIAAVTTSC